VSANMYSHTVDQPKRGFVTTLRAAKAPIVRTTAAATHRHGWRAGIARIGGAASRSPGDGVVLTWNHSPLRSNASQSPPVAQLYRHRTKNAHEAARASEETRATQWH